MLGRDDGLDPPAKIAEAEADHREVLHRPVVHVEREPEEPAPQRRLGLGLDLGGRSCRLGLRFGAGSSGVGSDRRRSRIPALPGFSPGGRAHGRSVRSQSLLPTHSPGRNRPSTRSPGRISPVRKATPQTARTQPCGVNLFTIYTSSTNRPHVVSLDRGIEEAGPGQGQHRASDAATPDSRARRRSRDSRLRWRSVRRSPASPVPRRLGGFLRQATGPEGDDVAVGGLLDHRDGQLEPADRLGAGQAIRAANSGSRNR